MRKYISTLALCALAFIGLGSCNKVNETDIAGDTHSVTFRAQLGTDTRTGLALKFVPNWIDTDLANVHLFETHNGAVLEGKDVTMETGIDGNYEIAYFTADYAEDMVIIVNPPSNAPSTRADASGDFTYSSIVAQRDNSEKYFVPATQYPGAETLIDPDADFLVGHSLQSFATEQSEKQVNLKFIRPVAISRLAIMNLEGTKVLSVTINAADALVGSASFDDVNFEDGTVAFTGGAKSLTMDYGTGVAIPAEGIFNAYFVSLTGAKKIQSIEVVTDEGTFTKDLGEGKTLTFKVPDFKSIAVNMDGTGSGPELEPQNISFVRGGETVTTDEYDLHSVEAYDSPTIAGVAEGATVTYETSDAAVATVSEAGVVVPQGVGEATIYADASKTSTHKAGSAQFTITVFDTTPEPVAQDLAFVKNDETITEDEFDLYPAGSTYVTPVLTGVAEGATVAYSITCLPEDLEVATINAETGEVTPKAVGVAVITATASAVTGYKETTKSYTLTVTDSTPAVVTDTKYYKASVLEAGYDYIIVSEGQALKNNGSGNVVAAQAVTVDNDVITLADDEADGILWYADVVPGDFTDYGTHVLKNGTENLWRYSSSGTYRVQATSDAITKYMVWSYDGEYFWNVSIYNNSVSQYYVYYSDGWKTSTTKTPATLYTAREPQTLTFTPGTATYDIYAPASFTAPVLSGNKTTDFTYASSDETIATVSAAGVVTGLKTGTVTITATAKGNAQYQAGSASYELTVVNSNPNLTKYTKVMSASELAVDESYIFVYEDGASSKVFMPLLNTNKNGWQTATANAVSATVSDGEIESNDLEACQIVLTNQDGTNAKFSMLVPKADGTNDYYFILRNNSSSFVASTTDTGYRPEFQISSTGALTLVRSNYYLRYSTSNAYFQASTSTPSNMAIYKLDDGKPKSQTLSLSATEVTFNVNGMTLPASLGEATPTLSGNKTAPQWHSSDETVAVVSESGAVTVYATGTATISVKCPAGTVDGKEYAASNEVEYTLTVVNVAERTYQRVTSSSQLSEDGTYLIVGYESSAKDPDPAGLFVCVFPPASDGVCSHHLLTESLSATSVTTSDADVFANEVKLVASGSQWKFKVGGQYLGYSDSIAVMVDNEDDAVAHTITPSSSNRYALQRSSSSSFYHSGSSHGFKYGSNTSNMYLYKLQ